MTPLISIIVPIYNVENYLNKCIDSILNQTYKNLEIILVDDGSTDLSGNIADEYAFKDNRIKVIHKENGGLSDARNTGLEIIKGDYVGFIDSDDYIDPLMYEKLYKYIQDNGLDVVLCGTNKVDEDDRIIESSNFFQSYSVNSKEEMVDIVFGDVHNNGPISVCTKLFKKHIFKNIRFPKGKSYEDCFVVMRWIDQTNRMGCLPNHFYNYRMRSGSITHVKMYNPKIFDIIEAEEKNIKEIKDKYPKSIESGILNLFISYRIALETIWACKDYQEHYEEVEEIVSKVKNISFHILKNRKISLKSKIALFLITINPNLYRCILKYKNK